MQNTTLLLICFVLILFLFKYIDFLSQNGYVTECFENNNNKYTHSVDLPLTTTYTCNNFCGPTAKCSVTGDQCSDDFDCPGCSKSNIRQFLSENRGKQMVTPQSPIPGNDDAGKLTAAMTPNYSPLTSGYATHQETLLDDFYDRPAMADFGVNEWLPRVKEEGKMFDARYKPKDLRFMSNYPQRYTLTGTFEDDGPMPSNALLL